ncbi:MAG: hypothetical protein JOZ80_16890 [Acidobacteriaceae bacterium]|nr:hypothetical protein [Acidobacteriaceae bacterium]
MSEIGAERVEAPIRLPVLGDERRRDAPPAPRRKATAQSSDIGAAENSGTRQHQIDSLA